MTLEQTRAGFHTTRWTLVDQLHDGDVEVRRSALDAMMRCYWPAVYAWLRREGYKGDDAAEIVQHFFADVVLGRHLLERTERSNGRLRSFLLTSLRHFLVDRHRRNCVRGGEVCVSLPGLGIEEQIAEGMPAGSSEDAFERRWALAMFEEAMGRCERHFCRAGRAGHWAVFQARIVAPARSGCGPRPLADLAAEYGFATPADAAAAVQVVKRRVLMFLREVVAETAASGEEQEEEYQRVMQLLA
jgi:DNA-directed RNA polymerase specialized sigma24 family protein